ISLRHLFALDRLLAAADLREPLDVGHAVPAGHDQPEREAVLRRQRSAVHLVGDEAPPAHGLGDGEAGLAALLELALPPAVEAREHDVDPVAGRTGLLEQLGERDAAPTRGADRRREPWAGARPGTPPP